MKYLGYALLSLAAIAGYLQFHPVILLVLALGSTGLHAAAKRRALKQTPMAPDQSMLMDGAYLFFGQLILMFMVFILGFFFARATPSGMLQRTVVALVVLGIIGVVIGLSLRASDRRQKR